MHVPLNVRLSKGLATATLVLATLVVGPRALALAQVPLDLQEEEAFRQAVRHLAPSLVRIQTVGGVDRVGGMLAATAATTGVVVSEDGWIVSSADRKSVV